MISDLVCKLFRLEEPVAKGLALGTAAHAIGTAKAMELGEIEGAMSSLAIAVAGLLTVVTSSVFCKSDVKICRVFLSGNHAGCGSGREEK